MLFFKDLENPLFSLFNEDYFWIKRIKWKSRRTENLSTCGYLYSNRSMSTVGSVSCKSDVVYTVVIHDIVMDFFYLLYITTVSYINPTGGIAIQNLRMKVSSIESLMS